MCQDTGTAIVMGKKSEGVLTGIDDGEAISRGVHDAYTRLNLRYSQLAPLTTYEEKNTGTNLPAQIEIYSTPQTSGTPEYKFLFMAKGGGSANKSFLFQETKAVLNPKRMLELPRREDPLARHGRLPAVPPRRRHRRHQRGVRAEDRQVRLGALPRQPADRGLDGRPRLPRPRAGGAGLRADPVVRHRRAVRRQVLLPRRARRCGCRATAPRAPSRSRVSCSADRQALGKITPEGVFLEQLETDPAQYLPDHRRGPLEAATSSHRPQPADARHPRRALEAPGQDAALADRHRWSWPATSRTPRSRSGSTPARACRTTSRTTRSTTPARPRPPTGYASGSFGPTTAGRMDSYVESSSRRPAARW
jgi:fumarate hydratase, class I